MSIRIHNVFDLKLLKQYANNLLPYQYQGFTISIIVNNDAHWDVNNILNLRRYWGRF